MLTDQQHPITPPPDLVQQIRREALHGSKDQLNYELRMIHIAFRSGADQELEACCEWLEKGPYGFTITASAPHMISDLREARRPKPPSLAEQALTQLDSLRADLRVHGIVPNTDIIRRALERLQQLEQENND